MSNRKLNYLQEGRLRNLATVQEWIREAGGAEKMSVEDMLKKIKLVLGTSHGKAVEYLELLGVDVL